MSTFDDFARDQTDQSVDLATQARHLAYLRSLPAGPTEGVSTGRRRHRRRFAVAGLTAGIVIAAGGGSAAAIGLFGEAADTTTGYCYATANLDESGSNRTEFATAGIDQRLDAAAAVSVDVCAAYWRSGVFTGGTVDSNRPPAGGSWPVPPLIACVLPSGKAAVFPGDPTTCHSLGLSALSGRP